MRRRWLDVALLVAVVAILAGSFLLGSRGAASEFAGTDSTVTAMVEEQGHRPWFSPVFEPGSSEIESGLFALQAGLGALALGYCLGRLHARRLHTRGTDALPVATSGAPAGGRGGSTGAEPGTR